MNYQCLVIHCGLLVHSSECLSVHPSVCSTLGSQLSEAQPTPQEDVRGGCCRPATPPHGWWSCPHLPALEAASGSPSQHPSTLVSSAKRCRIPTDSYPDPSIWCVPGSVLRACLVLWLSVLPCADRAQPHMSPSSGLELLAASTSSPLGQ